MRTRTSSVRLQELDGQCLLGGIKPRSVVRRRCQLPAAMAWSIAFCALA